MEPEGAGYEPPAQAGEAKTHRYSGPAAFPSNHHQHKKNFSP